jgi:tRNA(Ile)-lysidine synthase
LGVSGGADSLALMHGLDVLGYDVVVAHVDHGLRAESLQEADFVRLLAESRGLLFYSQRVDVQQVAETQAESIEEAARNVRYQFLFEQARRH